jgi:hypothetical protein
LERLKMAGAGLRYTSLAWLLIASACAAPITQMGSVTREQIADEQVKQQRLFLESQIARQARLDNVALPLLQAGAPLCSGAVTTRIGIRFTSRSYFNDQYLPAAMLMGLTDTVVLAGVTKGSGAERVGLRAGDRLLSANGSSRIVPEDNDQQRIDKRLPAGRASIPMVYRRDSIEHAVTVPADTVCAYDPVVITSSELNAYADGRAIYVTSRMLEFASDDDELATVVGHEIAHNAMHHTDAQTKNATVGALFGAILDIAAATQHVNTGGAYANQFAKLGAQVYSQDFEREADYVGLYILAGANRPITKAPNLWRRIAQESPTSITFGSSHPTTAERFVRLDQWSKEVERKVASGGPVRPELKNGTSPSVTMLARASDRGRVVASAPTAPAAAAKNSPPSRSNALAGDVSRASPANGDVAAKRNPTLLTSTDRVAVAVVGAPTSEADRNAGRQMYDDGVVYLDRHEWGNALESLRKAVRFDGSVAKYHAALGSVEMILGHWEEAEAEYTAASLIDVDNAEYRAQIKEARRHRS